MYFPNPSYRTNSFNSGENDPPRYNMVDVRVEPPLSPYDARMRRFHAAILCTGLIRRIDRRTNDDGWICGLTLTLPEEGLGAIDTFLLTKAIDTALKDLHQEL